jgi:hypothetical protein
VHLAIRLGRGIGSRVRRRDCDCLGLTGLTFFAFAQRALTALRPAADRASAGVSFHRASTAARAIRVRCAGVKAALRASPPSRDTAFRFNRNGRFAMALRYRMTRDFGKYVLTASPASTYNHLPQYRRKG